MILDYANLMSDDQAIVASAASTNVIDVGGDFDIGKGQPLEILVQVTEAFNTLTNLAIAIQTDSDEAFGSATTLYTETVLQAALVVGKRIAIRVFPNENERYIRMYYTVTGSAPTTGKITAGIVVDTQQDAVYPNAI